MNELNYDLPPEIKTEAWDRQEGETNFWYSRFHRFMLMGSSRSINSIYRTVINEKRAAEDRERLGKAAQAPSSWREIVHKFDWYGRAEAWDNDRRVKAVQAVAESTNLIRFAAQEAVQFQINLMRGVIKLKDREGDEMEVLLTLDEIQQMRLASNSILNRAGVVYDGLQAKEEDGTPEILGIMIHRSEE